MRHFIFTFTAIFLYTLYSSAQQVQPGTHNEYTVSGGTELEVNGKDLLALNWSQ